MGTDVWPIWYGEIGCAFLHSTHPEPDPEPPGVPIGEPVGKGKGKGVVAQPLIQIASHVKPYSPTWRPDWRAGGEDSIYIYTLFNNRLFNIYMFFVL